MKYFRYIPYLLLVFMPLLIGRAVAETNTPTAITSIWANAQPLTTVSNSPNGAQRPVVAEAPNGDLIVVYLKQQSSNQLDTDPFYRRSYDGGTNWTIPLRIYTSAASSRQVDVAFDNQNRAHAVWTEADNQLWYAREDAWVGNSAKQLFSATVGVVVIDSPKLAVDSNGILHLVWFQFDINGTDIYYSRSTNGGANWTSPENVSNSLGSSESPALVIDDSNRVHLVWDEQVGGSVYQINYSLRNTTGVWTTPVAVSTVAPSITSAKEPDIFVNGSRVMVAFEDRAGLNEQYLYYLECTTNCTASPATSTNWISTQATTQAYTAKDTDPTYLGHKVIPVGSCRQIFFSGIDGPATSNNEKVRLANSCDGFTSNPIIGTINASLGSNDRAIKPSVLSINNWIVYIAYERKGLTRSDIYLVKGVPVIYLPTITKN
ncbi:MAG: exo-alpha-sialidase [Anaerolineales bacterium]|nr:exo-alpha-sialidase [Anaerolineales bacterium]